MTIKPATLTNLEDCRGHVQSPVTDTATHNDILPSSAMPQEALDSATAWTDVARQDPISAVALTDIARLFRLQRYQRRRAHQAEEGLHHLHVTNARTLRLVRAARYVQHTLAECIRAEDKPSFVNLLHAFRDACRHCFRPTSPAVLPGDSDVASDFQPTAAFLQELPSSSRSAILDFLGKVRYNDDFLADQLASLSHKELLALLPDRAISRSNESVLGGHAGATARLSRPLGYVVDAQVDTLSSFAFRSPLEALVFTTRGMANHDGLPETERATRTWAKVCAKLISEQRPGSERLVPAVFDIWTSLYPWPGKERLEVWIQHTLQDGSFLLEHPIKQTFRARVEGRSDISVDEELRAEKFYSQAVDSLLDLLGDCTGLSILPPGVLKFCDVLTANLATSPRHQKALPHFVVTRWLFSSFVIDAISLPEAHGLLTDHYVSEVARQRILREVALRAQKAVFDVTYSWKYGNMPAAETTRRVNSVMARFQPCHTILQTPELPSAGIDSSSRYPETFLTVSAKDVLMCLHALYPRRRPSSIASDSDNIAPGLLSSSSSVSGFSLFRHTRDSEIFPEYHGGPAHLPSSVLLPDHTEHNHGPDDDTSVLYGCQMRDACLELEDFISTRSATMVELWDVLYARPDIGALETMQQTVNSLEARITTKSSITELGNCEDLATKSCMKSIELLLREHASIASSEQASHHGVGPTWPEEVEAQIDHLFEDIIYEYEVTSNFVGAHSWYRQHQDLRGLLSGPLTPGELPTILGRVNHKAQLSLDRAERVTDACENWARLFDIPSDLQSAQITPILAQHDRLRDKLWYVADVRTSAAFEEVRAIAAALRIMGKPKRLSRSRTQPPLRHWNTSKLSGSSKTDAQILEILSAKPNHGGPNKLSDEQSRAVELWMDRQNIDNVCKGEERLHKLCMEVRRCVENIMNASTESSTIWSNTLFAHDVIVRRQTLSQKNDLLLSRSSVGPGQHSYLSLQTHLRSNDALSTTSKALSSVSSRDYLDISSPTLTSKSSIPFWSPATTESDCPSSATSVASSQTQSRLPTSRKLAASTRIEHDAYLDPLRQRVTSLLLSDLTSVLFSDGSETDHAFWSGLGGTLTDRHFRSLQALNTTMGAQTPTSAAECHPRSKKPGFDFNTAFTTLLAKFSATSNAFKKLDCLYDIDRLLTPYMAEKTINERQGASPANNTGAGHLLPPRKIHDSSETSINGFRDIFCQHALRHSTIFRDLQYIAALLPSSVLQNTPQGKAFCNAAVAISGLKQEARMIMVETADSIIAYHSNNRGHGRTSSTAQQQRDSATFTTPSRTPSAEDVSRYSMADAAYLLQITAKEGDAVAQRELATLYLTHPELMDPIVAPFARPRDVFKDELESKWRRNQDPARCDPATMCVAHHWMSLSSKGGDSLAKEYLRQREEMDSF